jgi:hypothetical protein
MPRVAVVVPLIPLVFPPGTRSTGLALTYALGVAIFGGTATYVVTRLVGVTGDPLASTYYVMAANAVLLLAAFGIRNSDTTAAALDSEVRGREAGRHARVAALFGLCSRPKVPDSTDLDRATQFTPIRFEGPRRAQGRD